MQGAAAKQGGGPEEGGRKCGVRGAAGGSRVRQRLCYVGFVRLLGVMAGLVATVVLAADPRAEDLLNGARKGDTALLRTLVGHKLNLEVKDKDGRTPLMLAAQHGHVEAIRVLLGGGAKPEARDKLGFTAYGLAVMSSANGSMEAMKALPHGPPLRLAAEAAVGSENLTTSCFLRPAQLAEQVQSWNLDTAALDALREYVGVSGKGVAGLIPAGAADAPDSTPPDAIVSLRLRPTSACVQQQSADDVGLALDIRVTRPGSEGTVLEKTFGTGLKGLHANSVNGPAQYAPVLEKLARSHAGEIYWAVVGALLRSGS